ncbi:hypothetical protein AG1IA_05165 [Rhizoctonia solani AG-1 IA]|uniref:Uncharacterized protein n=1 Tax=Thanatephorus cucumeris (strain AG1-IA) TaxID=983506 RepID=L8WWV6_THACA|nr:hypothetical protein AG1IA_05165 [Rhizoctonia solani AG-1 IA]
MHYLFAQPLWFKGDLLIISRQAYIRGALRASKSTMTDTTETPIRITDDDIVDSDPGIEDLSVDWWRHAHSVNNATVRAEEYNAVESVSLHGRRCLITGETAPSIAIIIACLIANETKASQLARLQYALGRKINPNSRWFNLFLRSDIHCSFDATPSGWVLIPIEEDVRRIKGKILTLIDERRRESIDGPWPDFRSPDKVPIVRRQWQTTTTGHPVRDLHYPPYPNFPVLCSHVHPYAVILNAVPKIESHMDIPGEVLPITRELFSDLSIIYHALMDAWKEAPPRTDQPEDSASHGHPTSPISTRLMIARSSDHSVDHPSIQETSSNPTRPPANAIEESYTDEVDIYDNLSDDSEAESCDILNFRDAYSRASISFSIRGDSLHSGSVEPAQSSRSTYYTSLDIPERPDFAKWITSVETARQSDPLPEPQTDDSPESLRYRTEPARSPPTHDWHSWTSEFAPWWVVLPKRKNCGALSSNDWVEIRNLPPLTRKMDDWESEMINL